jgi:hypothetical protein
MTSGSTWRAEQAQQHRVYLMAAVLPAPRIAHRQATAPHQTFAMNEADIDQWREQFQVPDAAELDGGEIPNPPAGWPGWPEWAADHWPSCTDG